MATNGEASKSNTEASNGEEQSNQCRLPDLSGQTSSSTTAPQGEEGSRGAKLRLPEVSTEAPSEVAGKSKLAMRKVKRKAHRSKTGKFSSSKPIDEASRMGSRHGSIDDSSRRGTPSQDEVGSIGLLKPTVQKQMKGPSRAPSRMDAPSRAPSPGGFLPKVRGATFTIVEDHPFFKDTSDGLRQEIIPHVVKRHLGEKPSGPPPLGNDITFGFERAGMLGQVHSNSECNASSAEVRDLVVQGDAPTADFDGLLLTDPRFDADIEVLYDGHLISCSRSNATFNAEVALGFAKRCPFTLRLKQEPSQVIYFIPRTVLEDRLRKEAYAQDAALLHDRAQQNAKKLYEWFSHNSSRVKLRLFTNVCPDFKTQLVRKVTVRFAAAGSIIQKEGTPVKSCLCIYIGVATVSVQKQQVCKLTHDCKAAAWAAWWGFLEASGTCELSPASVQAITDCLVWDLTAEHLKELRAEFQAECSYFDKVAVKHVKMLTPFAVDVWQVPVLRECAPEFLQAVSLSSSQRICVPGDLVVKQDDRGSEMFVLVRGQCSVFRGAVKVANLSEGMCFGELAVLGISDLRTATIIADTVCDLRVLNRTSLLKALSQFPDESARLQEIAEAHGYSRRIAIQELKHVPDFHFFQEEFIQRLAEHMYEQAFFVGQTLFQQDLEMWHMYVLVRGEVVLEMGKVEVCQLEGPSVLGAMSLVHPGSRSLCGMRCGSVCEVLTINTKQVSTDLHNEYPQEMVRFGELAEDLTEEFRNQMLMVFDELSAQDLHIDDEEDQDHQSSHGTDTEEPKPGSTPSGSPSAAKRMSALLIEEEEAKRTDSKESKRKSLQHADDERRKSHHEDYERRGSAQEHCPIRWSNCFFADSDKGFLKKLSSELQKRIFFDGQIMLREGECGQYALLLHSGVGVVEVGNTRVAEVKRGDFLGEVVLLGFSEQYTATIKAAGLVTAYAIDKHGLREALDDFPDEKNRLEEVMKKRVKLTRQLTKITAFCSFVGKDHDEHDHEDRRKSSSMRRSIQARASVSAKGRASLLPGNHPFRNSLMMRRATTRGSRASVLNLHQQQQAFISPASPPDAPHSPKSPRHGATNWDHQRDSLGATADPPSTAGRSSITAAQPFDSNGSGGEDSDGREATASSRKTSAPKLPGRAHGRLWVERRCEALKFAHWRRKCAQARLGQMTEMLPPGMGYRATQAGLGLPFACFTAAPEAPKTPSSQRLRQAESVYGKPVWHEVFGEPMAPMELPAV
mmetsp:Transcript_55834/g.104978  ORF Transcript_55834/g.104978 Transcript_55834/m.104978 type:complete len:1241 (-) Transcript_55834:3-3725(-)